MENNNRDFTRAKFDEENAAWHIEFLTGRRVSMMPEMCRFDFLLSRVENGLATAYALAEYRGRPTTNINEYDTLVMDVAKINTILGLAEAMNLDRVYIIGQWADTEPMYTQVTRERAAAWLQAPQGRSAPLPRDFDTMVYHIPICEFSTFA